MASELRRLDRALRDEPAQLIATVHDEAVMLVPDDVASVERIGAIAQQEMIAAFLEVFPMRQPLILWIPRLDRPGATCSRCPTGCSRDSATCVDAADDARRTISLQVDGGPKITRRGISSPTA